MSQQRQAEELRAQVRRCRRLARGVLDCDVSRILKQMADEYEAKARDLDHGSGPHPRRVA